MINQIQKQILILALRAGELMMKNGAETYRVEDTISRICKACNISYVEVFAISTGIFVSLDDGKSESDMLTFIKRIDKTTVDLGKISRINQFSREFTTTQFSPDEGMKTLKAIDNEKQYHLAIRSVGAALVSAFFCLLFGGTWNDFPCAFLIGTIVYTIGLLFDRANANFFIKDFICSSAATLSTFSLCHVGFGENSSAIIIGVLMLFVPGVSITNSIRDLLSGNMLGGVLRMTEALVIAISLAAGAGIILKLWTSFGGVIL